MRRHPLVPIFVLIGLIFATPATSQVSDQSISRFAVFTDIVEAPRAEGLHVTLTPAPMIEHVTVVSASRQEELRDTLNTRVDVITRRRIEESGGAESVGEILRELPGRGHTPRIGNLERRR